MQRKLIFKSTLGVQNEHWGVTMHSLQIIKFQFEKDNHTLLCILELFTNIVHELFLKNAWLHQIFFLDFNNTC